ncbi:ABC transporter substrate-binding protein [Propioniciclava soli]|uniref:ABC transporter substrate-binding protein n=1 Tax=Propioniciclava soli TaxID=2775081 RepID=UPI001E3D3801
MHTPRHPAPAPARMLSRRTALGAGLAGAAGLAALASGCARTPAPTSGPPAATIGLTYIPDIQFAPFYVAEAEGLFADAGVAAKLRHHGAQEGLFTALAAGQEQYVIAGGDELVQARAQGVDAVAIAQYYRRYPVGVIVPDASPVVAPGDLRGRSVGVPARSGETWFGLQALLAESGLTEADVSVVEIGYTQQAALATGQVEAVVGFVNNDQVQFINAGIPTRVVPLTASGEVPLVSIVLATTRAELEARGPVATAVATGMVAGVAQAVSAPASAIEAARAHMPTLGEPGAEAAARATLEATIPLWTDDAGLVEGALDPQAWDAMTTFMWERGLIAAPVDPALAMTNDHVSS